MSWNTIEGQQWSVNITANTAVEMTPTLTCAQYIEAVVGLVRAGMDSGNETLKHSRTAWQSSKHFLTYIASPVICLFGIVGNILNLIVLTRKQLQRSMDRMERSVSVGLIALAASDMAFCIIFMTAQLIPEQSLYSPYSSVLAMYFKIYQEGLVNIFMVCSTWLTVNMALGRYVAICHPLHARGFINLRATRLAVIGVFLTSVLLNLPRFWHYHAVTIPCDQLVPSSQLLPPLMSGTGYEEGATVFPSFMAAVCDCVYRTKVDMEIFANNKSWFVFGHGLLCFVLAVFIPLVVLTVCNVCLVRALRRSYRLQTLYRANKPQESGGHRITPTLIAIIVLFTVLVAPADFVNFAGLTSERANYGAYEAATVITNFLLTINFAVNFVLYCVVNAQFRKTARDVLCCRWYDHDGGGGGLCWQSSIGGSVRNGRAANHAGSTMYTCNYSETEMQTNSIMQRGSNEPI